jgi:H/ACA ribonucleoprotein complex subunit 4
MWLVKSEEETDERYGKRPEDRTMEELIQSAVINVDKQSGPTSHTVTSWIRDIFKVKKAGHAGTLDPKVTGVLPVALQNATKAMPVLMGLDKEYVGVMHLHKEIDEETLRKFIVKNFVGVIEQVPPVRSAVVRKPRKKKIYFFDVLEMEGKDVLFKVGCEAGTYIRKLCWQIGEKLGIGAHMTELRRTKVGHFTEDTSHSLVEIRDAYEFWKEGDEKRLRKILIPVEHAILHVKRVFVNDTTVGAIAYGAPVFTPGIVRIQEGIERGETIAIYSLKGELVALGIARMTSKEMFEKRKGLAIRTDRVFIKKDVYPYSRKK